MTQGFHAEPAVVVQLLNAALALETRCVLRDRQRMARAESFNSVKRKAELTRHATAEQRHADQLMHRIVQLGGEPNVSPEGLLRHSSHEYSEEHSMPDWSTEDLMAERLVMESYREMIVYIGNDDPGTRRLLVNIVTDEANHVAELARRLGWLRVSAHSPFSSVFSWRTAFLIQLRKIMSTLWRMRLPSARRGVHTLEGTHEQYTGCTSDKEGRQACEPSSGTSHGVSRTISGREMTPDTSRFDGGHDSFSELDQVHRPSCWHMGMVRAARYHDYTRGKTSIWHPTAHHASIPRRS
jgi:bacterioferritin